MWISRDERRLLAGYYAKLAGVSVKKVYHTADLVPLLKFYGHKRCIYEYGQQKPPDKPTSLAKSIKCLIKDMNRIKAANKLLEERGMIKVTLHATERDVIVVELTVQGYDLGHKYHNPIIRSGLWFAEYKQHWFWLIVAYFAGILSAIIVNWFS